MQQNILKYGLISGSIIVLIPVISGWIIGTDSESFRIGPYYPTGNNRD